MLNYGIMYVILDKGGELVYNSAIKIITIALPILLFVFKYILPMLAKCIFGKSPKLDLQEIIIELINFPADLLFVAISYAFPNIIEVLGEMKSYNPINEQNINVLNDLLHRLIYNGVCVFILFLLLPFCVFATRYIDKQYFKGNKVRSVIFTILMYIFSIVCIIISLSL